jgi:SAM-dependent methyltransferase
VIRSAARSSGAQPVCSNRFDHARFWDQYALKSRGPLPGRMDGALGEEWGSPIQAGEVVARFVRPHLAPRARIVEIGPGGGKYTRLLVPLAGELVLADVSAEMLAEAARTAAPDALTVLLDGTSLLPLEDAAHDAVLAFDVFIHLELEEVFRYLGEANRVLRQGGLLVITASNLPTVHGGLAFYRQVRDHLASIGERYGGRIHGVDGRILRWLGEHAGFAVIEALDAWDRSELILAFRKEGPPMLWRFAIQAPLRERYELGGRVGGTLRRPLHHGVLLPGGEEAALLLEDARPRPERVQTRWEGSRHVPLPARDEVLCGTRIRAWPGLRALSAIACAGRLPYRPGAAVFRAAAESLMRDVDSALDAGAAAPDFDASDVVVDLENAGVAALGFETGQASGPTDPAAVRVAVRTALAALARALGLEAEALRLVQEGGPAS